MASQERRERERETENIITPPGLTTSAAGALVRPRLSKHETHLMLILVRRCWEEIRALEQTNPKLESIVLVSMSCGANA